MLEQGRDMAVRSGSFAAVAAAVARGADLRLYMSTDTYGTFYEEVMNFKQTLCRPDSARFSGLGPFLSSVHHGRDIEAPFASFFNYDTCRGALEGPTHSLVKWLPDGTKLDESNYNPQTPANCKTATFSTCRVAVSLTLEHHHSRRHLQMVRA